MDDAARVRRRQPVGELQRDVRGARDRQRALVLELVAERQALEQLHDDEAVTVGRLPEVLHVDDVLVADLRDRARLVEEARDHLLVRRQLGMDDLERDALADDRMLREEHVAHRAGADLLQHLVVADGGADANHAEIIALLLRSISELHAGDRRSATPPKTTAAEMHVSSSKMVKPWALPSSMTCRVAGMDLDAVVLLEAAFEDEHEFAAEVAVRGPLHVRAHLHEAAEGAGDLGPAPSAIMTHEFGTGPSIHDAGSSMASRSARALARVTSNSDASLSIIAARRGGLTSSRMRARSDGGGASAGSASADVGEGVGRLHQLLVAARAAGDVRLERLALAVADVAEEQIRDAIVDVRRHRDTSTAARSFDSAAATRDLTVPMGARTRSAISDDDSPSK